MANMLLSKEISRNSVLFYLPLEPQYGSTALNMLKKATNLFMRGDLNSDIEDEDMYKSPAEEQIITITEP